MIGLLTTLTMILMMLVVRRVIGVIKLNEKLKRLNETEIAVTDN